MTLDRLSIGILSIAIDAAEHCGYFEKPDAWNRIVEKFLAAHPQ
jgi:pimeloyl-ACP methyl ester carboxylesterase